jgi:hypothetical protein
MTSAYTWRKDILPITRITAALLLPFLLAAGLILYVLPDRTEQLFAWTITPRATALIMGAGYLSGLYFFGRALTAERWESIAQGFPPIAVFAWLAGITTLLHWDRFNKDHIAFFAWAGLYAITPFVVPGLWLLNRSNEAGTPKMNGNDIPAGFAAAIGVAGVAVMLSGAVLFLMPEMMMPTWPWQITPLTARILGSFFILTGLVDLSIAANRRWSAVQFTLESQLIGLALMLLGIPRALEVIDRSKPLAGILAVGLGLLWLGLAAVYIFMMRQPEKSIR